MPTNLTVNGNTYAYPIAGEEPGWGSEATGWAEEVTSVLADLQGIDDIPETIALISNNQASPSDVVGLAFNPTTVRSAVVNYSIYRVTDTNELAEQGTLNVVFKNNAPSTEKWSIGRVFFGDDAGVEFTMTDGGQIRYTSSNVSGANYSGEIVFQAAAILQ